MQMLPHRQNTRECLADRCGKVGSLYVHHDKTIVLYSHSYICVQQFKGSAWKSHFLTYYFATYKPKCEEILLWFTSDLLKLFHKHDLASLIPVLV